MTYVKQTWVNGPAGLTPISATRLNHIEDGITAASTQLVAAATGNRIIDEANLSAAIAALPSPAGGKLILSNDLSGGGVYIVEQLTAANLEYLEIDGQGSTIQLADDDGEGGLGQILVTTDVIKTAFRRLTFHGNAANSKSGAANLPLVLITSTVATASRKDFRVILDDVEFTENAGGYGHIKIHLYETSSDTYPEFENIRISNVRGHAHGYYNGISIRGPGKVVDIEDLYYQNDGEFGLLAVGDPAFGSQGKPLGISCDITFGHVIRQLNIRNYFTTRTQGPLFTQMVKNASVDGVTSLEISTNPYYDTAPIAFTVDPATDILTTAVPSRVGGAINGKNYGTNSIVKVTSTGTPPAPLLNNQMYFVRDSTGTSVKLCNQAGGTAIDITDAGTGTHSLTWMGYTYDAGIKGDDNKHEAVDPSQHTYRNIQFIRSSPHSSRNAVQWVWTAHTNAIGRVILEDGLFDSKLDLEQGTPGLGHRMTRCHFASGWLPNIDNTMGSYASINATGRVDDCSFPANFTWTTGFDCTIQNTRFGGGVVHKFAAGTNTTVRYTDCTWNILDTATQRLEITPPATGNSARVILKGNRRKSGATQQTWLRVSSTGDIAGLDIEDEDNDFGIDANVGVATSTSLRWKKRYRTTKRKLADQTVNNSSDVVSDTELKFPVGAHEVWKYRFALMVATGALGATSDLRVALSSPSGASVVALANGPGTTEANLSTIRKTHRVITGTTPIATIGTLDSATVEVIVEGTVTNGATAGDLVLQWAQSSPQVSDTTVKAGSTLEAVRL